jgi:RNA polymerase sigma-70 factor (ECF subfamily)
MTDAIERLYEQVLVLRCQAGDQSAFEELVLRYAPRLAYFLRRMLGPDRADDVLQEVWVAAFRGLARLAAPAAFSTWLYRIARDRAYRELRTTGRANYVPLEEDPVDVVDDEPAFSADDAQRIHQCLNLLSPEHREVLTLRFIEDMSYDEIASVVGGKVGTIRSWIYYAKQALRRLINVKPDDV